MINIIKLWFNRYFSDPDAVLLLVLLLVGFSLIIFMSNILAPVLISIVFAYLLEWLVKYLEKWNMKRLPAVLLVYLAFLAFFLTLFLVLIPLLWKQVAVLFADLPSMLVKIQAQSTLFVQKFPEYFSEQQLEALLSAVMQDAKSWGTTLLSASISSIPGLLAWLVYLVLIPLLVFFFLKDRAIIHHWLVSFLPEKRGLVSQVSQEVSTQIGNYCRGKMIEIFLSWLATYMIFSLMGLKYAMVLGFLLGLSTLIPYVGPVMVMFPVALVAYLQWGWGIELGYVMSVYFLIQALLGNVVEPLLFSEALNLHPVAIIVATLFFGGIWGFWGVFFAIPLATLVKAVLNAWPRQQESVTMVGL